MTNVASLAEQASNMIYNSEQDYSHITDPYFREKLDLGLIKYDPEEWTELEPIVENELR